MSGLINLTYVVNAVLYSFIGVLTCWLCFRLMNRLAPFLLWKEITEEHNTALAIIVGAMSLGICIIIAAAIHA